MSPESIVHVLDSHQDARAQVIGLLHAAGMNIASYGTAAQFLAVHRPDSTGCLVADFELPDMEGLELQQVLRERESTLPVVFLSDHADFELAVLAMKRGAADFITRPVDEHRLLDTVQMVLAQHARRHARSQACRQARRRLNGLTPRERDVLSELLHGKSNKMIADTLGLSPKTVEFHRGRIMLRTRADSLADLIRTSVLAEHDDLPHEPDHGKPGSAQTSLRPHSGLLDPILDPDFAERTADL